MEVSETDRLKQRLDLLVKMLVEDKPNRTFISVVGMGGCGKTTLVDKAYREKIVSTILKIIVLGYMSHSSSELKIC